MVFSCRVPRLLLSSLLLSAVLVPKLQADEQAKRTVVPVLINLIGDTYVSADDMKAMIAEANKIYKQAGIKLKFNPSTDVNWIMNDGGNNDSKITKDEEAKLDAKATKELREHTDYAKNGLKICIADEIRNDPGTLGLAGHDPSIPVVYIKTPQKTSGSVSQAEKEKAGRTITHEASHVFTLSRGHLVDDKDDSDSSNDVKADSNGHTTVPNNLMNAYEGSNNKELTPEQIAELHKGLKKQDLTPWYCLWPETEYEYYDASVAVNPAATSLVTAGISHDFESNELHMQIAYTGQLSPTDELHTAMYFDADCNPATGRSVMLYDGTILEGIDRTFDVNVMGDPEAGGVLVGEMLDELGNPMGVPLQLELEHVPRFVDNEGTPDETSVVYDSVRATIDPAMIALGGPDYQAWVATDDPSTPAGVGDFFPNMINGSLLPSIGGPELVLLSPAEALPGEMVSIDGLNFYPDDPNILIELDDMELGIVASDATGYFHFEFEMPMDLPDDWYFITASAADPADPTGGLGTQYAFETIDLLPLLPGDANGDGRVDGSDVTILAGNWQYGVGAPEPDATWSMGDFNGDGMVDGSDVTILAGNWQAGVYAASAVPEPSTLVSLLILLTLSTVARFARWR